MSEPAPGRAPGRIELWTRLATLLLVALLVALAILGSRPGGRFPVGLQRYGLVLVAGLALLVLAVGLGTCALRRPVLQPGRLRALVMLGVTILLGTFPFAYPSSYEGRVSRTAFRLPFEGSWRCLWGGRERSRNPLVLDPSRCFGFTFLAREGVGKVLAPAAGEVVALEEGRGGRRLGLRVAEGEYLFLEPLEPDSLAVAVGERVAPGQRLGTAPLRTGRASGRLLQLFLQDDPEPGWGEGVPLSFHQFLMGSEFVSVGAPRGALPGEAAIWLQNAPEAPPGG